MNWRELKRIRHYVVLLFGYFVYSLTCVFTKKASLNPVFSDRYCLYVVLAILILGIYAIIWQQVLKRIELTTAYMFKGTSLVFVLLFSALIFNETITLWNIVGASLIVGGIVWFARA